MIFKRLLINTLEAQVVALAKLQNESGLWHTLLDDENSYLESSATAGFAYGILKAVHKRYLPQEYKEVAYKAIAGLLQEINENGEVQKVSMEREWEMILIITGISVLQLCLMDSL